MPNIKHEPESNSDRIKYENTLRNGTKRKIPETQDALASAWWKKRGLQAEVKMVRRWQR